MSSDLRRARAALVGNFLYGVGGRIVLFGSGIVVNIVLARTFGPGSYGFLFASLATANLLLTLVSAGMHTSLNVVLLRDGKGDESYIKQNVFNILLIQIQILFPLLLLLVLGAWLLSLDNFQIYVIFFFQAMFIFLLGLPQHVFWSVGKFSYTFIASSIRPVALLVLVLFVVASGMQVERVPFAYLVASALACVIGYALVFKISPDSIHHIDFRTWRHMIRRALPLLGLYALLPIYVDGNIVLVRWISGDAEAGNFVAAARLLTFVIPLASAFELALFPKLQDIWSSKEADGARYMNEIMRGVSYMSLVLVIFLFVYADEIMGLMYGDEFTIAGTVLRIVSAALFFRLAQRLWSSAYIILHKERTVLAAMIGTATIGMAVSAALIFAFGARGAAAGTLFIDLGIYLTYVVFGWRSGIVLMSRGDHLRVISFAMSLAVLVGASFMILGPLVSLVPSILGAVGLIYLIDRETVRLITHRVWSNIVSKRVRQKSDRISA